MASAQAPTPQSVTVDAAEQSPALLDPAASQAEGVAESTGANVSS